MALVHDARVVGVAGERRVHRAHGPLQGGDELVDARARHQHVVGRDARLPGVQELRERDAACGFGQVAIDVDDRRRLPAELQRDGRQILGRGERDLPADRGRAGEEQVIERQPRERASQLDVAGKHGEFVGRERLGHDLLQQRREPRRELARLQHHAIARGQRGSDGQEGEL